MRKRMEAPALGVKFGKWTVVGVTTEGKHRSTLCECDCGTKREVALSSLFKGTSSQCLLCGAAQRGKALRKEILPGSKWGEWTVVGTIDSNFQYAMCKCACGKEIAVRINSLRRGISKKCRDCRDRNRILAPEDVSIATFTNSHGYENWRWRAPSGKTVTILEHRIVMASIIGRELLPTENVHHLNGDRADNSPSNLELWNESQPSGQRIPDKIAWAEEILRLYAPQKLA